MHEVAEYGPSAPMVRISAGEGAPIVRRRSSDGQWKGRPMTAIAILDPWRHREAPASAGRGFSVSVGTQGAGGCAVDSSIATISAKHARRL